MARTTLEWCRSFPFYACLSGRVIFNAGLFDNLLSYTDPGSLFEGQSNAVTWSSIQSDLLAPAGDQDFGVENGVSEFSNSNLVNFSINLVQKIAKKVIGRRTLRRFVLKSGTNGKCLSLSYLNRESIPQSSSLKFVGFRCRIRYELIVPALHRSYHIFLFHGVDLGLCEPEFKQNFAGVLTALRGRPVWHVG